MTVEPDETRAADLLRTLATPPSAPSRVDIARAIADGERLRRRALWVRSGTAAVAVALVLVGGWAVARPVLRVTPAAPEASAQRSAAASSSADPSASTGPPTPAPQTPAPPVACKLRRLPLPAGYPARSIVTGADPIGRYILGRAYPGGPQALIWHDGKVRTVPITGVDPTLEDATATGVAVGGSFLGRSTETTAAWIYRDGRVSRLPGHNAWAYGINERQVIVGSVNDRPALWRTPTSQPTMLATPGPGWTGYAAGIDEDGTVVGRMQGPAGPMVGYLWRPDGGLAKLPAPALHGQAVTEYTADDIRNGWVAGWAGQDVGALKYIGAPLWNLRTGEVDTTERRPGAEAVNRYGWTVGGSLLMAGDRTVRLPAYYGPLSKDTTMAQSISDDGSTVAGQVNLKDVPVAVVWRCR